MLRGQLILAGVCCIAIAGCLNQRPAAPSTTQTAPPVASGTAVTPQSLTESQVESIVKDKLSLLRDAITYKRCTNALPTTSPPGANVVAAINGDSQTNYAAWLK